MARTLDDDKLLWHDLECGSYAADLGLWRALAADVSGPVLDVGAGTGRVTLDLARAGHEVTALDRDARLLAALAERAADLPVSTVVADARDFSLARRFGLCLVPMQTIQLLEGAAGRAGLLAAAARCLIPGGLLAAAIADPLVPFDARHDPAPLPDLCQREGWVYSSQPVATRRQAGTMVIERVRESVSPAGRRTVSADVVTLDELWPAELEREAAVAGLRPHDRRQIPPTVDHVGSAVVVLRA